MFDTPLLIILISAVVALATLTSVAELKKRRRIREYKKRSGEFVRSMRAYKDRLEKIIKFHGATGKAGSATRKIYINKTYAAGDVVGRNLESENEPTLLNLALGQMLSTHVASIARTNEDLEQKIDQQFGDLRECLAKIESRFPEEANLERNASINDALLSERISQLAKQVENLEKRLLSKWDVALIVGTMIAAAAFVVVAADKVLKVIATGS